MAENKDNKDAKADAGTPASGGRRLPLKAIIILAVALLIEGIAITGAFMFAGKPADVRADPAAQTEADLAEKPVEVMVIADKFQNNRSGRSYIIDTEIYVIVRQKNASGFEASLKGTEAKVAADMAMIFRKAEPNILLEPGLETINRQIHAKLDESFGMDPTNKPIIDQVLIKRFTQIPIDP